MQNKKEMPLILKIAIGFVIGIVLGFIIGPMQQSSPFFSNFLIPLLDLIGKIFIGLLKCSSFLLSLPASSQVLHR